MRLFIFLLSLIFEVSSQSESLYYKPVPEVIESYGYPAESHSVFTEDGFKLTLHRIPYGRNCKKERGTPVLVQHGLLQSSLAWLYLGPDYSLGFLLADDCYDVWLGNSRGTCYSSEHKYLKKSQSKYWDYSYHEIGVYDITASVDYILDVTDKSEILYVGVSEGTTAALVNAIFFPDIKIKALFLLAPVSYMTERSSSSSMLAPVVEPVVNLLTQTLLGFSEISYSFQPLKLIEKIVCPILPDICAVPLGTCGFEPGRMNKTATAVALIKSCPASSKEYLHYLQGSYIEFSEYSYGTLSNYRKYGSSSPPKYKVEVINKPVYLYHSRNDNCGDLADVNRLAKELGDNLQKIHLVGDENFSHLGFNLALSVKETVYDILMEDMREVVK